MEWAWGERERCFPFFLNLGVVDVVVIVLVCTDTM